MKTRKELQDEAIMTLLLRQRVIVNWGTGVGKSRVAVGCADSLDRCGHGRILLLVAETAHKANWLGEFTGALGERRGRELFSRITVECYASLQKYEWTEWDFIIADEAHHLRSESRTDSISTLKADYFLCLSATMSCNGDADDLLRMLEVTFGKFVNLEFGIQQAIDNDILKEPRIYVHVLSLDDLKIRQEIKESWGPSARRKTIRCLYEECRKYFNKDEYPALDLTMEATPKQAYGYYTERMRRAKARWEQARGAAGIKPGEPDNARSAWEWNSYVHYGTLRKTVLGRAKTTFCAWLLSRLGDKKYICFCTDVEQAVLLGGDNVIHAGRRDNMDVIDAYNRSDIRSLFAVNMIQEGQNLADIQAGVVIQLGGKERQFVQKFGRALRSSTPEQHIVVIAGTRDVEYYKTAVAGLNQGYIRKRYYGSAREIPSSDSGNSDRPGLARTVTV